ncbi:MAG: Abi family protein [Tannerellaceae bacterium]|nr:Abi family protein [Tannerellaceae bacterium]
MATYTKPPLSLDQQLNKLQSRGLIIENRGDAAHCLENISYYRLRAYTFPFQDNKNETQDHHFIREGIRFSEIIDLYQFDSNLRALIFHEIENIEVAFRTRLVYHYAMETHDSHWYTNAELFFPHSKRTFENVYAEIDAEIGRSKEEFLIHYKNSYSEPTLPPAWMALEVVSFGVLSHLYRLLKKDKGKKAVAESFGLKDIATMENWLHAISILRNHCAHHNRIWNRRFLIGLQLPYNTIYPFMDKQTTEGIKNNKLFAYMCCMKYLLDRINPGNQFATSLVKLMDRGGNLLSVKDMGFPENWQKLSIWNGN